MPTEQLKLEYVPLSGLASLQWIDNPKDHDIGLLHTSMERFGFMDPILVNEIDDGLVILAGHGRTVTLLQQRDIGNDPPEHIIVRDGEWLVPIIRGNKLNPGELAAASIALNRTVEAGGWNTIGLAGVLIQVAADQGLLGVGYDPDDIIRMQALIEGNPFGDMGHVANQAEIDKKQGEMGNSFKDRVAADADEFVDLACPECGHSYQIRVGDILKDYHRTEKVK